MKEKGFEKILICSCGSKDFMIVITRWINPMTNDENYYCSKCGNVYEGEF